VDVAGVILETYQGASASFAPTPYIEALDQWCDRHGALLVFDEVQAGFGRTGALWGFEHYGVVPDLVCFGKGISSSLPLSAVAGRPDLMDLHAPGSMTSTHTGNPVCAAAALASIELIVGENLPVHAAQMGTLLRSRLEAMQRRFPQFGWVDGKGLVAGVACVVPGSKEPDAALAWEAVRQAVERGVLMFSPVGYGGATIKINPPLIITEEALNESLDAFEEAFAAAVLAGAEVLAK
jgi:4-aminobutyrate aminotransferase / (S)-3-amino-2-methylpropionate transaminase / 5-aminovalerate transaminase